VTVDLRARRRPGSRPRRVLVALLLAFGLIAGLIPSPSGPVPVNAATPHARVVIVVGPTEGATSSYIRDANAIARQVKGYGAIVVKVYSPKATWSAVKAAAKGANLLIYLGHGTGWPNPYRRATDPKKDNGYGLNLATRPSHDVKRYYGEYYIRQLNLAPGAIVIFNHACYTAGSSEPGRRAPTVGVARQRAENYASGFLAAGARAVLATASSPSSFLASLFTADRTLRSGFWAMPSTFPRYTRTAASKRTPGATVLQAPYPATKYYDAITGTLSYTTAEWRATWK
jgi:hypothetical protein